ncbi:putative GIY-YIG endonuclease [Cafeteria roenbergensis virus]|uniref:Putative GIY-YIG endonuclease n=1 Tax=Cafeteria roenbergensis virus (strain BV-PW1) TaxID=693272 RepID=E3T4S4_CROVB|nr:putative GIY-YIG endonuclease [Cafeteria roenbergensis virus BV-PW1]ADO67187.1 putative GIY-YIG endonuclease [Cafeteria roenbergensis virus BV-PW1]
MSYYLYLLYHQNKNRTYLGISNNLKRRWRQHNGEIKGGAKSTTALLSYGKWTPVCISPMKDKSSALSYEIKIKNMRRKAKGNHVILKRINLMEFFNLKIVYIL